jgi:nucleotide-binding universal stress UspA family protein
MLPAIKSILYATDLSDNARHAFGYAAALANQFQARITILHVLEDLNPSAQSQLLAFLGEERWQELVSHKEKEFLALINAKINAFCAEMEKQHGQCPQLVDQILVRRGNPEEEILREAHQGSYDVVVMGTHGYGTFAEALMGSVARRVVRRCRRPVMTIRLPQ